MPPYHPDEIANEFIAIGIETSACDMSPMKLQKLAYLAHGWFLAFYDEKLIDGDIEAWEFGPVIPDLYHKLQKFGNNPVGELVSKLRPASDNSSDFPFEFHTPRVPTADTRTHGHLREVWRAYGQYTPIQLSNLTHEPGTPWTITVGEHSAGKLPRGLDIGDDLIKSCFKGYAEGNGNSEQ